MKKIISQFMIVVILGVMLLGCGQTATTNGRNEVKEKEVVIAVSSEISGTDIHQSNDQGVVFNLLYDAVIGYNLEMSKLVPFVANDIELSEDGKEIILTFPDDLKFYNGIPVTMDDIVETFKYHIEISPYGSDYDPILDYITDENRLILKCEYPPAFMLYALTTVYSGIINKAVKDTMLPEEFNSKAVGYGPTYIEEWIKGSHITFRKNDHYKTSLPFVENKGPLKVDKITVKFIKDNFTRLQELKAGNIDIMIGVYYENIAEVEALDDVNLIKDPSPGVTFLQINSKVPGLDDIVIREAIIKAINKEEIVSSVHGAVEICNSFINPAMLHYNEDFEKEMEKTYKHDLDRAIYLLEKNGWIDIDGDGIREKDSTKLSFELLISNEDSIIKKTALIIQNQLKNIGVSMQIKEVGGEYYYELLDNGNYECAIQENGWSDPDILSYVMGSKWMWIDDEKVDQMLYDARHIMDYNLRTTAYNDLIRYVMNDMPGLPLYSRYYFVAIRKNVTGFRKRFDGEIYFQDLDIE